MHEDKTLLCYWLLHNNSPRLSIHVTASDPLTAIDVAEESAGGQQGAVQRSEQDKSRGLCDELSRCVMSKSFSRTFENIWIHLQGTQPTCQESNLILVLVQCSEVLL